MLRALKKSKNEEYVLVNELNPNFDGDQINPKNSPNKLGDKQYGCPFCPKILPYSSRMKQHILIHTKEKPFKCDTCGKGFRQKGGLNQHLMIHTGEKKFWCNFCGKGFTYTKAEFSSTFGKQSPTNTLIVNYLLNLSCMRSILLYDNSIPCIKLYVVEF